MKIIEEPQLEVERKLPWLVDIFLYPTRQQNSVQCTGLKTALPNLYAPGVRIQAFDLG